MYPGVILVVVHLETESESGIQRVREVSVTVKRLGAVAEVVIDFAQEVAFAERLAEAAAQTCERGAGQTDRRKPILLSALTVGEEEQLVLDDRPAHAATELLTLEWIVMAARCVGCEAVIADETERFAVKGVRARLRGDVHR